MSTITSMPAPTTAVPGTTNTNSHNPINVNVNVNGNPADKKDDKKSDSGGHLAGRWLYFLGEGIIHYEMLKRCSQNGDLCAPIYQATYLTALAAGAVFGLYRAAFKADKESAGIDQRAVAFAKANIGTKAIMAGELAITGPVALAAAERLPITAGMTGGGFVSAWWGFSLGSDVAKTAYNSTFAKKA